MTGFTILALLTMLNAGDATTMNELPAFVQTIAKQSPSIRKQCVRQIWCAYYIAVDECEALLYRNNSVGYFRMKGYYSGTGRSNPGSDWDIFAPVFRPNSSLTGIPPHVYMGWDR